MDSHCLTTARQSFSYLSNGHWLRLHSSSLPPLTKTEGREKEETLALKRSLTPFTSNCSNYSQQKGK